VSDMEIVRIEYCPTISSTFISFTRKSIRLGKSSVGENSDQFPSLSTVINRTTHSDRFSQECLGVVRLGN